MRIYLSGKIGGLEESVYKQNFENAIKECEEMFSDVDGLEIINPSTLPAIQSSWGDYLIRDLMLLKECDAICMLADWHDSWGAQCELMFAKGCGMKVYYLGKYGND